MKNIYKIIALAGVSTLATSCFNKEKPNYRLFPDMYVSTAYETYQESEAFNNNKEGQLPAEGSIPRGFEIFEYENTPEGLLEAKANLKTPLTEISEEDMAKAAQLYTIYCSVCHGDKGDGKGPLVQKEKFLGVPSYADREINEGSIYFVETYGLNSMGSHKNQLSQHERWLVAAYVMKLKAEL